MPNGDALAQEAQEICQALLRMDTTNPPGRERVAAEFLKKKLEEVGYKPELVEGAPGRTNLVARWKGSGKCEPLLLTAHLDVVAADPTQWKYPPFSGALAEGCLWGRGAVDMKHMAAMSTAVMCRLAREQASLSRDVIFAAVADEETGCELGSRFLVEQYPELVRAEYALGECGGFSLHIGERTFYPVQVAEKGFCWVRARVRAEPGHGSLPRRNSAVVQLAEAVTRLARGRFPARETETFHTFLSQIVAAQPAWLRPLLRFFSRPRWLAPLLHWLPETGPLRSLRASLSDTASPTVLAAGSKINVIPGEAEVLIDGRTLPGQTQENFLRELAAVLGPKFELEVLKAEPPVVTVPTESPLLDAIRCEIAAREPDAVVVPYLLPGFTDAKYFSRLGTRWYGFTPLKLERGSGLRFADMFHGHNERIPVAGLCWGTEVLYAVVRRFCA